jgi:hypothetical protein
MGRGQTKTPRPIPLVRPLATEPSDRYFLS